MGKLLSFANYLRRYKYVMAFLGFLLIIGVVDENSLWSRYQRQLEIGNLRQEIDKYQASYEADARQLELLKNNPAVLEKVARERYFMKRPNEDIFVFVDEDETPVTTTTTAQ